MLASDYRVVVYNVFVERGNVAVLQCNIPASVRDFVEILTWWSEEGGERTEIHSGGRFLVTTSGNRISTTTATATSSTKLLVVDS